ncbi:MAG TPA: peptide chain release factor 1 [Spirochaetia bacterium]|nr:peptide chain release factor 1 [Spirochaetia bacterium]
MQQKLVQIEKHFEEVEQLLADPGVVRDLKRYRDLMREHSHLKETVEAYARYRSLGHQIGETHALIEGEHDLEMRQMAKEELKSLEEDYENTIDTIKALLIPRDPLDQKDIIMEIRAGTGGDEAALFASDLYRMYTRYAERMGWKIEIMSASEIEIGGFKEVIYSISGGAVYENLRYESGVHRVQRVPETEAGGRVHTSAVTVAVLPEAEETDIQINPEELKIDVYRSSGPGGQSVNTTDSAVRVTHLPTGLVVTCQDEKSQHKNRAKAIRVLRARLYELEEGKKQAERAEARRTQIGSGDRSERIRTYNFPQNRVTDHRINLTLYKLETVIQGDLDELVDALKLSAREQYLQVKGT